MPSPAEIGLDYQAIEVPAASHTLHAWFIPAAEPDPPATVLIHHGSVFNRAAYFAYYSLLHDLGCHVLIYDYRGFGESPGAASLATLLSDADAMLAYLQGQPELSGGRIVLFGISLGTLPALAHAARAPRGVVGVMLDGSFELESLPPASFAVVGVLPVPEVLASLYDNHPELEPTQYARRITLPKLFIHSPQDLVTPLVGAQRLFELAPAPSQWCEVFGGHLLSSVLDPCYADCVAHFLDTLAPGRPALGE